MTMLDTQGKVKPLIERLRQACQEGRELIEPWDHDPYLYGEAADEIERLRAALDEACQIALGTDLTRQAAERIKELHSYQQEADSK